jgi:hypothetical protein
MHHWVTGFSEPTYVFLAQRFGLIISPLLAGDVVLYKVKAGCSSACSYLSLRAVKRAIWLYQAWSLLLGLRSAGTASFSASAYTSRPDYWQVVTQTVAGIPYPGRAGVEV